MKRKIKIAILMTIMVFTLNSCKSLLSLGALGLMVAPLVLTEPSTEGSGGCRSYEVIGGIRRCVAW